MVCKDSEIQIPYKIMLARLMRSAYQNKMLIGNARRVLTTIFRIPRTKLTPLLVEMKDLGLITFEGTKYLVIEYEPDERWRDLFPSARSVMW